MSELLSSLDVVNKAFKKTMRGYDPGEVDEFLDRVAESIQAYVQKTKDYERTVEEQAEKLADYDNIKSSLHEALLMAQRTAEEKVSNATRLADEKISDATTKADDIVAEAKVRAERMIREVEDEIAEFGNELKKLQQLREMGFSHVRSFVGELKKTIDEAEDKGYLEIPELTLGVMKKKGEARRPERAIQGDRPETPEASAADASREEPSEAKKMEISDTLNALGIDPNLLSSEI